MSPVSMVTMVVTHVVIEEDWGMKKKTFEKYCFVFMPEMKHFFHLFDDQIETDFSKAGCQKYFPFSRLNGDFIYDCNS